jgi:hypothetical protein
MNWLRTLILAGVMAAVAVPAALPSTAQAHPSGHGSAGCVYYPTVYYRSCPHDAWHAYGQFYNASYAANAVRVLNYYGYEAFYR